MCISRQVVYRYGGGLPSQDEVDDFLLSKELYKVKAEAESIVQYFNGSSRKNTFLRHLKNGSSGYFLVSENEWVTYAWMSVPESKLPKHIPFWVKDENVYWIYYCRTKENFRGNGFYKAALKMLIIEAYEKSGDPKIFIDTISNNVSSRRAILSSGFLPEGIITAWSIKFLKMHILTIGLWKRHTQHPALPQ